MLILICRPLFLFLAIAHFAFAFSPSSTGRHILHRIRPGDQRAGWNSKEVAQPREFNDDFPTQAVAHQQELWRIGSRTGVARKLPCTDQVSFDEQIGAGVFDVLAS
jgi:hypothetical protein